MLTHDDMPDHIDRKHAEMHRIARGFYRMRNEAQARGDATEAARMHDIGDVWFGRALALTAEWEADLD